MVYYIATKTYILQKLLITWEHSRAVKAGLKIYTKYNLNCDVNMHRKTSLEGNSRKYY